MQGTICLHPNYNQVSKVSYFKVNPILRGELKINQRDNLHDIEDAAIGSAHGVFERRKRETAKHKRRRKECLGFEREREREIQIIVNEFQREREVEQSWYPQQQKGRRLKRVRDSLDLAPPQSLAHSVFVMNIRSLLCCFFPIEKIS